MEIHRAKPVAGDSTAGDRLEISCWRIDLDGFLLDELIARFGIPKVPVGLLTGEENRILELAADQRCVRFRSFENRAAAGLFREEDFRDVEHRINPGDLMDLLADQVNGVRIRTDGDTHSFLRIRFLGTWWSSATIVLISSAILERAALAIVTATGVSTLPWTTLAIIAPRRAILTTESLRLLLLLVAGGTCPRGSEREAGQEAAQWIGF